MTLTIFSVKKTLLLSTQISELYKQKRQKTRKHQRDKQIILVHRADI